MTYFTYPRDLDFYHPDYQVGCGGNETPMTYTDQRTYLYVWNVKEKRYEYYCWETDLFLQESEVPWNQKTHYF